MEKMPTNNENVADRKKREWEQKLTEIERIADGLGYPIEEGIKEGVAALQLHGFKTTGSCEGHNDWGLPYPWVQMRAEGKPVHRWENEDELRRQVVEELHFEPDEVDRKSPKYDESKWEKVQDIFFDRLPDNAPETQEYIEWSRRNVELAHHLEDFIARFYATLNETSDSRMSVHPLFAGREPRLIVNDEKRKDDEKEVKKVISKDVQPNAELIERVSRRQAEMKRFVEFLKNEFFKS